MIKLVELTIEEDFWISPPNVLCYNLSIAELESEEYLLTGGEIMTKNEFIAWWNRASSNFEFDLNSAMHVKEFTSLINAPGVLYQWDYDTQWSTIDRFYYWWLEGFTKADLLVMLVSPTLHHRQIAKLLLGNTTLQEEGLI